MIRWREISSIVSRSAAVAKWLAAAFNFASRISLWLQMHPDLLVKLQCKKRPARIGSEKPDGRQADDQVGGSQQYNGPLQAEDRDDQKAC